MAANRFGRAEAGDALEGRIHIFDGEIRRGRTGNDHGIGAGLHRALVQAQFQQARRVAVVLRHAGLVRCRPHAAPSSDPVSTWSARLCQTRLRPAFFAA